MAERGEKYVPKNLIADVEKGKWWIKRCSERMAQSNFKNTGKHARVEKKNRRK